MRRLATMLAVLTLATLAIVFALLGTAGGGGSSRSSDAPSTSSAPPKPLTGPSTFTTGIADPVYSESQGRNQWLSRTVGAGARFVLLWVSWSAVAPQPPPAGTDPSDPANPAYDWGALDATVRAANAHGLAVVLSITSAPTWAEGPHVPAHVAPGTWRPNAAARGCRQLCPSLG